MNKIRLLSITGLALLGLAATSTASDKRTANYLLTTPLSFEGKDVTVDVAFVKPIHWVSPFPEMAFFHVVTIDRGDRKPSGVILAAVASSEAAAFAKKYGTDHERKDVDSLKGIFMSAGGGRHHHGKVWLIDTTGGLQNLIDTRKLEFPREVLEDGVGPAEGGGRKAGRGLR